MKTGVIQLSGVAKRPHSETMIHDNVSNAMAMMDCSVQGLNVVPNNGSLVSGVNAVYTFPSHTGGTITTWDYWQNFYYPQVILQSYPVYLQDKSMDKGKQAFEILKSLIDKKLINLEKVKDFVEAMDTILKTL